MRLEYHLFQISVVSGCTLKRLGDLPFDFLPGTCGTFMVDSSSTILLCFGDFDKSKCRSLTRRNGGALDDINDFNFDSEFEIDRIAIPDSTHQHYGTTMANYQGLPLILGGVDNAWMANNKLEMLNTMENTPSWIEGNDYPYTNRYVISV